MLPAILLLIQAAAPATHDAVSYDITLVPSDTSTHLLGEVQTGWRLRSAAPLSVQLDSSMRVVRVLMDGKPNTRLSRTLYGRSAVDVVVEHEKQAGDTLSTRIRYHGFARGGVVPGPTKGGERGAAGGGDPETARLWLPVPDDPDARAPVAWHVQAPVGQRVLASGRLERVDTIPYGHTTWHYRLERPAPIGRFAVTVGPYVTAAVHPATCDGCAAVEVWSYPTDSAAAAGAFHHAGEIADFCTRLLGPFPYDRLVHAEAADPADAAGAAGMVLYRESLYGGGGGPSEALVARETARQWLGLAVSPDSADDRRLFEGMPLYLAALWQDRAGAGGRPLAETMRTAADSVLGSGGSDPWRGAWTLHELRGIVGDSAFARGLRLLYRRHRDSTATAADVARAMSEAAGRELDWLFRQAGGAEVPALDARVIRRGSRYVLSLRPDGPGELRMPGLRLLLDGKPVRADLAGSETTVELRGFRRAPARIELDPAGTWLVRLRRAA